MPAELQTSRHQATLLITLNGVNPVSLLQDDIHAAVIETLSTAESDRSLAGVVLSGLEGFAPTSDNTTAAPLPEPLLEHLGDWVEAIQSFPKPVFAAVDGRISGPGLALMLACDLVVAGRSSTMNASAMPEGGVSWFLAQSLPPQAAMELLMHPSPLPASRWQALGVINRLVDDGAAGDVALQWAAQLATETVRAERIKSLLKEAAHHSLAQQLSAEAKHRLES